MISTHKNSCEYNGRAYFHFMREVSKAIVPEMQGMLTACYDITNGNLGFDISTMLECRCSIRRPKLRPFIAAVCAGASGGTNFKTHEKRIGAAVELLNLSTYYANIAFDGKRNCKDKNEVTMFCLAAMLLRDSVFEYLAKHGLSSISALRVIAVLSKGYLDVSKGQVLDICQLSGFNGRVLPTPDDHLRLYIRRCALLGGGSLMSVCLAGGLTGGMDEGSLVKMARYGWWHGTALQIINDISDFAPVYAAGKSVGKTENDRYADLLACKLTLPNFHLCKEICGDICDFKKMKDFICHELQADNQQKLSRIFSESLLLAEEADVLAAESIRTLPSGIRQILAASLIVSKKNKFYTQLQCRIDDNMLCVEASARMRKALLDCPSNTIPGDDHFEEQILCLSNQKTNFGKL